MIITIDEWISLPSVFQKEYFFFLRLGIFLLAETVLLMTTMFVILLEPLTTIDGKNIIFPILGYLLLINVDLANQISLPHIN